jgi:hypothetical protein
VIGMDDLTLRYYCIDEGNKVIRDLLEEVRNKLDISYEIVGEPLNELKDREIYDRDFKPGARLLKKGTAKCIRELRSRSGHYFVSVPRTIAVIRNGLVEWWTLGDDCVTAFLKELLKEGREYLFRLIGD